MKLIGKNAYIFLDSFSQANLIAGTGANSTIVSTKYFIYKKGAGSNLPGFEGSFFQAPKMGITQLVLVADDSVLPLNPKRFCKTSADISFEQGVIDISDDCTPGASMLDGVVKVSGSFSGFYSEDEAT